MGISDENNQECLVMGKGVAFGKKVGQTVSAAAEAKVYSLKEMTERGDAKDIIKSVSPLCLELANEVLSRAEKEFEKVDRTILFTMADHLDFAIRRVQKGEMDERVAHDYIDHMIYEANGHADTDDQEVLAIRAKFEELCADLIEQIGRAHV